MQPPYEEEHNQPKPQVEFAGEGPGRRIRTAVGASGDDNQHIDPSVLPEPPLWFTLAEPLMSLDYKSRFRTLPLELALQLLEKAGVPPLYRKRTRIGIFQKSPS